MKTLKTTTLSGIAILLLIVLMNKAKAQEATIAEVKIKTSAICSMCKETIEKSLAFEKGVKRSNLDVASKEITVVYNPKKTDPEKIRIAISKAGYDADEVFADKKAYDKLEACCKKGAVCTDKK